jgi:integrase
MPKRDIFNHGENWDYWKKELTPNYIEEGLTKENSKLYIQYLTDLELGANMPKTARKGARDVKTLNRLRSKMVCIFKILQNNGIKDVSKATETQVTKIFYDWVKAGHSPDYSKRFKAFWHWWANVNRKQGKVIADITEDIDTTPKDDGGSFVWLTKEEFDEFRKYFDEEKQIILLFCFDTIIRAPTELLSLKVENVYTKSKEVWIEIPKEISKTIGRKFNLVYSGDLILNYIRENKKKPEDYLFDFSPGMMNENMQKIAEQLWKNRKSEGGEFYKNITLYDLRHSGAIHFRQLFQKTGASLDILRERGGWTDFKMINYYTKRLGLDGHISKEKLLLEEDKTNLEKEMENMKKQILSMKKDYEELYGAIALAESPNFGSISDEGMQPPIEFELTKPARKKLNNNWMKAVRKNIK